MALSVTDQSTSVLAASRFFVPFTIEVASMSQPEPSDGNTISIGAPCFFCRAARNSNDTPIGYSPAPAMVHGLEPECVYTPMFWWSASMYFQPSVSPKSCSQLVTSRNPVPEEAGFGITIVPLYTGLVRSFHEAGLGRLFFWASTVLKQMAATHASMPTHVGGLSLSRNCASSRSTPFGAYAMSMPSGFSTRRLVAARPQMTSACGLAFSASSLAVMTPVESRTHLISMAGWSSLKRAAYFLRASASTAGSTVTV